VGGDKPLPYFPVIEDNPFLGWRGIRISLDHPDIFLVQVRAMLRANEGYGNMQIMLPMITDVSEIDEALRLIRKAYNEVVEDGCRAEFPKVGAMIEVPSAVYQARGIARRVDFLSVGSNDLTQYLLAVDRNNSRVATLYDSLHPSVLQALRMIVTAAHIEGKRVSICGEMAGDPVSVVLLVAMGFDCLSMNATSLPRMKWVVRQFSMVDMQLLLAEVMEMENAALIRSRVELALDLAGLGGLIRAGR
jgi:phosphotransferase system enzyme I (PtsP)